MRHYSRNGFQYNVCTAQKLSYSLHGYWKLWILSSRWEIVHFSKSGAEGYLYRYNRLNIGFPNTFLRVPSPIVHFASPSPSPSPTSHGRLSARHAPVLNSWGWNRTRENFSSLAPGVDVSRVHPATERGVLWLVVIWRQHFPSKSCSSGEIC